MNIKKASELTGVSSDTIRYYERIGLIPPVTRNMHGVRNFQDIDIRWIEFSRHMRNAGLSVEALIEYIQLFQTGDDETIPARIEILQDQVNLLKERMQEMQEAHDKLVFKINNYETHMIPAEKKLER
ncbi:MerR family transcriptional regulator [Rummeliibacillus suwonensis]|uniref:MerR family transcriptional regulator n=1 Tax=Rummeliibacillus suwonensis TaxID=1306154 RepID=UPI001AAFCD94|nr:MerR family transcriptional regulator [Rummeliibacillus suwonensis]MBO2536646.1 MerR family transcriptional regulator [Rummeliibacillus suwonensis]